MLQNQNQKNENLAVIYSNQYNIWNNVKQRFCYVDANRNINKLKYAMPIADAEILLVEMNSERRAQGWDEAYILTGPNFEY
jgi:NRPS condensation-like uncharacterized protein